MRDLQGALAASYLPVMGSLVALQTRAHLVGRDHPPTDAWTAWSVGAPGSDVVVTREAPGVYTVAFPKVHLAHCCANVSTSLPATVSVVLWPERGRWSRVVKVRTYHLGLAELVDCPFTLTVFGLSCDHEDCMQLPEQHFECVGRQLDPEWRP